MKTKSSFFSSKHYSVIKIVFIYFIFAFLWIILSDNIVAILFSEPEKITQLSLVKGIFFVVTTSFLLFFIVRNFVNEIKGREAQLEMLLKNIPDFVFFKDINGVFLACNKTTEEFFGSSEADIVGKTDYDFFSKEQAEFFREKDSEAIKSGKSIKNEEWHTDPKTGEKFLLETIKTPIFDKNKNISGVLGIARDITIINDAKNTLFEKVREQERLEKIAESVPGVIYTYKVREDGTHYFSYISPLAEKYFGLPPDKLQEDASCFLSLIHKDDYENYLKSGEESAQNMAPWHGEFRYIHPEKGEIWIEGHSRPVKEDGESISWHGFVHDITQKKHAEMVLKSEKDRSQRYLDTVESIIVALDSKGQITLINRKGCEIFGYTKEELLGQNWFEKCLPQPEGMEVVYSVFLNTLNGNFSLTNAEYFENYVRTKSGELRLIAWHNNVLVDSAGVVTETLSSGDDITERRKVVEALKESEELYRSVVNTLNEGIIVFYKDGSFKGCNYAAEEILGLSEDDIRKKGANFSEWNFIKEDGSLLRDYELPVTKTLSSGQPDYNIILGYNAPDGKLKWHLVNSSPVFDSPGGNMIMCVVSFIDITKQFVAQQELKKLSKAVEQVADDVMITDIKGNIEYVNPFFEKVTGFPKEEVIGRNITDFESGLHSDEFYEELWDTISSGNTWSGRFLNRKKDGEIFTQDAVISPIKDENGRIVNYVAVRRDITRQLKIEEEKEKLQQQLNQSQKMESVGRLAGGVAHDFNNMLGVIIGYAEIASMKITRDDKIRGYIAQILKAAEKSADLVKQLLTFASKQVISPKVLDLNDTVSGMLKMLRRLIREEIELVWIPEDNLWFINIDPSQVDQLLANIVVNARDAISGVGKITIKTENVSCDYEYCFYHPEATPGDYVMLSVSDNGHGMDDDTLKKIFEPFFTTKEFGKGTGLGLATVYGIMRQNKGFINAESKLEEGTTFKAYLPRFFNENVDKNIETENVYDGAEHILLVEDEKELLGIYTENLENMGYKVLAANTAKNALLIAEQYKDKINFLITDVIMPEMNGGELLEKIKGFIPDIKCLFISGYTADIISQRGIIKDDAYFLAKPFIINDLAKKVREILDNGR